MTAKHTPGPWTTYAGSIWSTSPEINKSKRCNTVASISPRWKMPEAEKEANARLIAAAPELRAHIEKSLDWLASYPGGNAENIYNEARALLALIDGEETETAAAPAPQTDACPTCGSGSPWRCGCQPQGES